MLTTGNLFDFSPLCIFTCFLKLLAWYDALSHCLLFCFSPHFVICVFLANVGNSKCHFLMTFASKSSKHLCLRPSLTVEILRSKPSPKYFQTVNEINGSLLSVQGFPCLQRELTDTLCRFNCRPSRIQNPDSSKKNANAWIVYSQSSPKFWTNANQL